jgi:hypothetical protein
MEKATEWVRSDQQAILDDIARLGIRQAAEYNLRLAEMLDEWKGISIDEMEEAIRGIFGE